MYGKNRLGLDEPLWKRELAVCLPSCRNKKNKKETFLREFSQWTLLQRFKRRCPAGFLNQPRTGLETVDL